MTDYSSNPEQLNGLDSYERMPKNERGFVLIGPSGVGKSTLRDILCDTDETFVKYRPLTSRSPRPNENDEYRFVSKEEIEAVESSSNAIFGNESYGNRFLTLWPEKLLENQHYLYIYLPEAATTLKEAFPETRIIQILPSNLSVLEERIKQRDPNISEEELLKRVSAANDEIQLGSKIADGVIMNDGSIEDVAERLKTLMAAL